MINHNTHDLTVLMNGVLLYLRLMECYCTEWSVIVLKITAPYFVIPMISLRAG